MKKTVSPKQVAKAIGASESSVKRWCDRGILPSVRTVGGHRRLTLDSVLKYIRDEQIPLVDPAVLGLPVSTGKTHRMLDRSHAQFATALLEGQDEICRQIVFDLYLAGHPLSMILDDVVSAAFHNVGDQWCDGDAEVYQERRGCEIATRFMHELRTLVLPEQNDGPKALGASPEGDPYSLPTHMVELVLRQSGWQATSLGSNVPIKSLIAALLSHRPRIFWLSVSAIADAEQFVADFERLQSAAADDVALVVGGRALDESIRTRLNYTVYCDKLQNLDRFAATLHKSPDSYPRIKRSS